MKKIFTICISVFMVLTIMISTISMTSAKEDIITGSPENGFTCELNKNTGVLTIEGLGMLIAGDIESALPSVKLSEVKEIVVKEGVYFIHLSGWGEQPDFSGVTAITLPSTLKKIAGNSFEKCSNLQTINYGGSEEMWQDVIIEDNNGKLTSAQVNYNSTVPVTDGADSYICDLVYKFNSKYELDLYSDTLRVSGEGSCKTYFYDALTIGTRHFDGFSMQGFVKHIVFQNGITSIGSRVLYGFENLETLTLPKTLKKIYFESFGDDYSKKDLDFEIYYEGSKAAWDKIKIEYNNTPIMLAKKHFDGKAKSEDVTVALSKTSFIYKKDAGLQYPDVTVKDKYGNTLVYGEDYYVEIPSSYYNGSIDKYSVVIKLMGDYSGEITKTYYIKPKTPTVTKTESRSGGFTVTWEQFKKANKVKGFEVQYSTSSDFAKAETITISNSESTAKKVTGLKKGKTYYVRVRSVAKGYWSGKTITSAWSKTGKVKAG